ncbi:MAG: hypothetical protein Q8O33_11055 [Pseudomonadota bacterium]|nr:hypothetical protein [Pseudomonadota bacterium]
MKTSLLRFGLVVVDIRGMPTDYTGSAWVNDEAVCQKDGAVVISVKAAIFLRGPV